ncbi:hypothetical protein KR018_012068 [Drosophila ironensis]|nr:hypothetical protein KR018_012068 [Drosophila ironensis]
MQQWRWAHQLGQGWEFGVTTWTHDAPEPQTSRWWKPATQEEDAEEEQRDAEEVRALPPPGPNMRDPRVRVRAWAAETAAREQETAARDQEAPTTPEPWERPEWVWPEAAPAPHRLQRQASDPGPRGRARPTLQRQSSGPQTGAEWAAIPEAAWPRAVHREVTRARHGPARIVNAGGGRFRVRWTRDGVRVYEEVRTNGGGGNGKKINENV